jgi:hypothetical protein
MNRRIFPIFQCALLILICACAKISAPSGGPKDKLPPVVVKSIPENGTKNFSGKRISVAFNEYVVLEKINDKFLVSPPMKKKPTVMIRGKSVVVEFEETLKDSTTYTLYFQDAIRDLNEGNIFNNYRFVFSTGSVIDSLSVTGNVYNADNLEVPESAIVLLYRNLADSVVKKQIPDYISRVDLTGYFRFDNISPGRYRLYALKDADNSKTYNLRDEEFAFLDSAVVITPEKNYIPVAEDTSTVKKEPGKVQELPVLKGDYQLFLFAAKKKEHYLTSSSRPLKYHMIYTLSLPPDSSDFEFSIPDAGNDKYIIEKSRDRDTINVWLTDSSLYSRPQITTMVKFPFTDSTGTVTVREDTIVMRFLSPRAPRVSKARVQKLKFETNMSAGSLKPGQKIYLKSPTPFKDPDTARIKLYELVETKKVRVPYTLVKDKVNSCLLNLTTKLQEDKKYLFVADSASVGNIYNEYCDSTGISFAVRALDSFVKLTVNIHNCEGSQIIQLLTNSEKFVSEAIINKDGKVEFPLLEKGIYRLCAIYDLNSDGKWTAGDFSAGKQPEPVLYYTSDIEIKAGYELEQDWTLGEKNFKDQKLREKKKSQ